MLDDPCGPLHGLGIASVGDDSGDGRKEGLHKRSGVSAPSWLPGSSARAGAHCDELRSESVV